MELANRGPLRDRKAVPHPLDSCLGRGFETDLLEATTEHSSTSTPHYTAYRSMVIWVEFDNTGLGLPEESSAMSLVSFCPYRH